MSGILRDSIVASFASLLIVALVGCDVASKVQDYNAELQKKQLMTALESDDFETAEAILVDQVDAAPDDGDLRFRLAMIQNERGKTEEAVAQMQQLVTTQSHKEAARWLISNKYRNQKWSDLTQTERDDFGSLAKILFEAYPSDPATKSLYADYLVNSGKLSKALPILESLANNNNNPHRGLQAAAIARSLKDFEKATALAESSLDALIAMSEEDPANLSILMAVSRNQLFLEQYPEALKTLNRAIKSARVPQEHAAARQAFGDAMVLYVKHIEENSAGTDDERVRILETLRVALIYAPKNPRVLAMISKKLESNPDGDNEKIAALREALQTALIEAEGNADERPKDGPKDEIPIL